MESLYRIVFLGELVAGLTAQQIIEAFAARFRVSEDKARQVVLGGYRTVLKRGLDPVKAQRYSVALRKVGLLVVLEPEGPPVAGHSVEVSHSIEVGQTEFASNYYADLNAPPAQAADPAATPPPAAAALATADWPACPKCGDAAVSPATGICQACGLVVERYRSRRSRHAGERHTGDRHTSDKRTSDKRTSDKQTGGKPTRGSNPYTPPAADLTLPPRGWSGERLHRTRAVRAGRGLAWVAEAWDLFKDQPWSWFGAGLLYLLITTAVNFIPAVGGLVMLILGPILTGGLMIGAHVQFQGGGFGVAKLFAGFRRKTGSLALIGVTALCFSVLFVLAVGLVALAATYGLGGPDVMAAVDQGRFDPKQFGVDNGLVMLLTVLVFLLFGIVLGMALFFAPALVALNDVPVLRAFKLSFQGCWRNVVPFLVTGFAALVLFVTSLFTLGLGLLVLMPVFIIVTYMAFRDIYYR